MQFIFVEFWVTLEITLYDHGYWHFVFGIEIKQIDCTIQLNKYVSKKILYFERKNR